jgi:hypothetical protein
MEIINQSMNYESLSNKSYQILIKQFNLWNYKFWLSYSMEQVKMNEICECWILLFKKRQTMEVTKKKKEKEQHFFVEITVTRKK